MRAQTALVPPAALVTLAASLLVASMAAAGRDADVPTATDGLPPGFVTEEVEAEVVRVISDGVRDLVFPIERDWVFTPTRDSDLAVGLDGSVWLRKAKGLQQLGEERLLPYPRRVPDLGEPTQLEVDADGNPWVVFDFDEPRVGIVDSRLYAYDNGKWRLRLDGSNSWNDGIDVRLLRDGSAIALWSRPNYKTPGRYRFLRIGDRRWSRLPKSPIPSDPKANMKGWDATDDGQLWMVRKGQISRYDGRRWKVVAAIEGRFEDLVALPSGKARILYGVDMAEGPMVRTLRKNGDSKGVDGPPLPDAAELDPDGPRIYGLAPDGSVWRSLESAVCAGSWCGLGIITISCDGIARFDGEWRRYLPDMCVQEVEFDDQARAWVQASPTSPGESIVDEEVDPPVTYRSLDVGPARLYVITPESVGAELPDGPGSNS